VKRIRARGDVLLAPCDARGRLRGPEVPGTVELQDAGGTARTTGLIRRRYGLLGWILTRRGGEDRQGLTLRLTTA
jgi:PPOX class probable F420-dependent enzyme